MRKKTEDVTSNDGNAAQYVDYEDDNLIVIPVCHTFLLLFALFVGT
jgi:hypothetical protein